MIDQVSLINYFDPDLSKKLNKREQQVYTALKQLGQATSWDILNYLKSTNPNLVRPRLTDLYNKGLIIKSHQIRKEGVTQWVWMVKE